MIIQNETPVHLIAEEGMMLTNGEIYSTEVWLGRLDSPENWREIPIDEVPNEEVS